MEDMGMDCTTTRAADRYQFFGRGLPKQYKKYYTMSNYIKMPEHVFLDYIQSALTAADVADEKRARARDLARTELQYELSELHTSILPLSVEKRKEMLERVRMLQALSGQKS